MSSSKMSEFFSKSVQSHCPAHRYLQRPPENLTINGYRNWIAGYMTQNQIHWDTCRNKFKKQMGKIDGELACDALGQVVRSLGNCALCPLKCNAPESSHLASDECMLLGLIASIQHGDDEALQACAYTLTCKQNFHKIISPASEYAAFMKACGSLLLPIPASVISDIHLKSQQPEQFTNITLH